VKFHLYIYRALSLRRDQQQHKLIDEVLRAGAVAVGTNMWVLFFAILIASVGLNVNSTAVIIGAMLISPLMGPIVGLGYAAAVADFPLIRTATRNLLLFTLLSLATSTLYFALSPLDEPQSELLARTSPTLWDVLIAAFGGAAGMVAITRKSISNIVPGVAIATALMPPLCTAGFGLANGRWDMFFGASYLYVINSVFIAASSLLVAKLLRLPARVEVDFATRRRHRAWITVTLMSVLVPSVWLGYRFVQNEVFASAAGKVGRALMTDSRVLSYEINPAQRVLRLTTLGGREEEELLARSRELLAAEGVAQAEVSLRRAGEQAVDVNALRKDLSEELQRSLLSQVQANDLRVRQLEEELSALAAAMQPRGPDISTLVAEIQAQFPQVLTAFLAAELPPTVEAVPETNPASPAPTPGAANAPLAAPATQKAASAAASTLATTSQAARPSVVVIDVPRALSRRDRVRLTSWLQVRLAQPELTVVERIVRR
jgi:uncharacterized hydrophobic protein (TIGR00271 family)